MTTRADTLAHRIVRQLGGDPSAAGGNVAGLSNSPGDRSVSISQHPRDAHDVLVCCHNGADPIAFKRHLRGIGLLPSRYASHAPPVTNAPTGCQVSRARQASALWQRSVTAVGTPAEVYLQARGIIHPLESWARFAPACPSGKDCPVRPALVAAVTVPTTGEFRAVHRIFLQADGNGKADLPRHHQKRSLGPTAGAAVVLGDLATTVRGIIEGEGIETVLSACMALGRPGIATLSAVTLGRPALPDIRPVVILADRGAEAAATHAAERRVKEKRRVWIATPSDSFKDWNDVLRTLGREATRSALCRAVEVSPNINEQGA